MLFFLLFGLALAAAVADALTTAKGLSLGATEKNPVARRLFDAIGFLPTTALLKAPQFVALGVVAFIYGTDSLFSLALAGLVLVAGMAVVVSNLRVIRRLAR